MTRSPGSVARGSQRPTLELVPEGEGGEGDDAIAAGEACGIYLDEWQQYVLRQSLRIAPNGQWAATEVGLEVTRQNGKNVILEVLEIAGLLVFGEQLITHSAHKFPTAFEHFLRMREHIERPGSPLAELVDDIYSGNNKVEIRFRGGRRLKFLARASGGGRGFTGDRQVFDEAFSLDVNAMGAMIPALSARSMETPGPQIWYVSSPAQWGSAVLHAVRRRAQEGSERLAYFGWLNEPGTDRNDRDAWYRVNPSLGIRISEEYVETELAALGDLGDEFDRERLGVPSPEDAGATVFGPGKWVACADETSEIVGGPAIALDIAPEMTFASFATAGVRTDGLAHVELIERHPGTSWVVPRAKELAEKWSVPIAYDPKSPTNGLLAQLEKAHVPLRPMGAGDMTQACAQLQEAVVNGTVRHRSQVPLDSAVAGAAVRQSADMWTWARKTATADISPLVAATIAFWAAELARPSVYEGRELVVL